MLNISVHITRWSWYGFWHIRFLQTKYCGATKTVNVIFRPSREMGWFVAWSIGIYRNLHSSNPQTVDRNSRKKLDSIRCIDVDNSRRDNASMTVSQYW